MISLHLPPGVTSDISISKIELHVHEKELELVSETLSTVYPDLVLIKWTLVQVKIGLEKNENVEKNVSSNFRIRLPRPHTSPEPIKRRLGLFDSCFPCRVLWPRPVRT